MLNSSDLLNMKCVAIYGSKPSTSLWEKTRSHLFCVVNYNEIMT